MECGSDTVLEARRDTLAGKGPVQIGDERSQVGIALRFAASLGAGWQKVRISGSKLVIMHHGIVP